MTSPQTIASDPRYSVWVAASAGTGKTKVLTDRVLRLLLEGVEPSHILCLTYTNAAAAEMERRIQVRLGEWATLAEEELRKALLALTGAMPDAPTVRRARLLFATLLDAPLGLRVQTIHGFCQTVIRQFPLEAGISPGVQVIDEKTADELLQEAKLRLLAYGREKDAAIAVAFDAVAWRFHDGSFTELLAKLVEQRHKLVRLFHHYEPSELQTQTCQALGAIPGLTEEMLLTQACGLHALDQVGLKRLANVMLAGKGKGEAKSGEVIAAWLAATLEERVATFKAYKEVFFTQSQEPRKKLLIKETAALLPDADIIIAREQERLVQLQEQCRSQRVAELTTHLLHISEALLEYYQMLKSQRGVMDFNDMIYHVIGLLQQQEAASWVLYKLDGRIDHLLVDEAQDTSPEQWEIIRVLCEEFFAGDSERQRTLFVVGDEKQSIYSFQGAEPLLFRDMQHHYADAAHMVAKPWQAVTLNTSYRSTDAVLALVDAVFADAVMKQAVSFTEDAIVHRPHRTGQAGLVTLWPLAALPEEETVAPWPLPLKRRESPSPQKILAEKMASIIATWIETKRFLPAKGRAVEPGDILILVRRRNALVDYLVRALKQRHIPVAGMDRLKLTDHIAVKDMMALGHFLLLPEDDLTLATVLKSPLVGLTEEELFDVAYGRGSVSLWQRLKQKQQESLAFQQAYRFLHTLLQKAGTQPPFELFHEVLEVQQGRKSFLQRLGQEASDPLDEFLAQGLLYETSHAPSLQGFLHWLMQGETVIKRDMEQGSNEVRIMTVHGAKGLQAPIVFLPDTVQTPRNNDDFLWSEDNPALFFWPGKRGNENTLCKHLREQQRFLEKQEYIRLLYVALTRAEDELYIAGATGKQKPSESSWYHLIRQALTPLPGCKEMEEGGLVLATAQQVNIPKNEAKNQNNEDKSSLPRFFFEAASTPVLAASLTPSQKNAEPPAAAAVQASLQGIFVHRLLEILPSLSEKNRPQGLKQLSREYQGRIESDILGSLTSQALRLMEKPEFSLLFSHLSRAEVPLVGKVGNVTIRGQVDRLVATETDVYIIDYKTGANPPKNVEDVPPAYLRQMALYHVLLRSVYPRHSIHCALLWVENLHLMWLENEVLASYIPAEATLTSFV